MTEIRSVHARIEGRVQGVGYRAWVEGTAHELGLTGWARNRRDKSVEMVLQGRSDRVDEMLRRCELGPLDASVTKVEILGEGVGVYESFKVLPTT
jgi:acylphosphatase